MHTCHHTFQKSNVKRNLADIFNRQYKPNSITEIKFSKNETIDRIRTKWNSLRLRETFAESWERETLARERMFLLRDFDEREVPAIIDKLND